MKAVQIIGAIMLAFGVVMLSMGLLPFQKKIERQVMVNSHQYIEGRNQRQRVLEANIAEVDSMMELHPEKKDSLMAQRRALVAQLEAASQ